MRKENRDPALAEAIKLAGGMAPLGKILGISAAAIAQWRKTPAEKVVAVERATGVSRVRLRPDIFDPPPEKTEAAE